MADEELCCSSSQWSNAVIDHVVRTGHEHLVQNDDLLARTICVACATCSQSYSLRLRSVREDNTQAGTIFRSLMMTAVGRQEITRSLVTLAKKRRAEKVEEEVRVAPSSWDRLRND